MKVVVLGGGIIGTASAWYLSQAGHEVTLVERLGGVALDTGFANGGQISVNHCEPWANPGAPRRSRAGLAGTMRRCSSGCSRICTNGCGDWIFSGMPAGAHRAQHPPLRVPVVVQPRAAAAAAARAFDRIRPAGSRHPALLYGPGGLRGRAGARGVDARTGLRSAFNQRGRGGGDRTGAGAAEGPDRRRGFLHRRRVGRCIPVHRCARRPCARVRRSVPVRAPGHARADRGRPGHGG